MSSTRQHLEFPPSFTADNQPFLQAMAEFNANRLDASLPELAFHEMSPDERGIVLRRAQELKTSAALSSWEPLAEQVRSRTFVRGTSLLDSPKLLGTGLLLIVSALVIFATWWMR